MKYLCFACLLLLSCLAFAQKQNVYFLKNDLRLVSNKDSADFIRIVREPEEGSKLYVVLEYYTSGQRKRVTRSTKIDPVLRLEGQCVEYYPNGKIKSSANYVRNNLTGDVFNYFPNGKIYTVEDYGPADTGAHYQADYRKEPLIKTCRDSTGKEMVTDGNGHYLIYNSDFKRVDEEGDVKNGQRVGEWKGHAEGGKVTFSEFYKEGKLQNGTATDSGGTYKYTVRAINAQYKNGIDAFGRYLGHQISYPIQDREYGIQGTVLLSFVINKDGTVKTIKVIRHVSPSIDAEAVRVLAKSKDWLPAVYFGRQVSSKFTVPISFTLGH